MRVLKSAVCLTMLAAGIAAVPTQLAGAVAQPAAADDSSLVNQMQEQAAGSVAVSDELATGKVGFIRAKGAGADLLPGVAADDAASAAAKADAYLAKYSTAFGAAKGQLKREEVKGGDLGWTISYVQTYQGLPVFGSLLRAHVDDNGKLTAVNGYAAPDLSLSATPRKSATAAADRAIAFVRSEPGPAATDEVKAALALKAESNTLMVYRVGSTKGVEGPATLAYVIDVTDGAMIRDKVFVDANSGKILNRYSMIDNALDRELYEAFINDNGTPADEDDDFVDFELVWAEDDDLDAECTEPDAGDCDDELNLDQRNLVLSTGESYWFFKNAFGRDSYDGNGATMKTVNNDPRIACPNANWNGQTTNYCDGVTSDDVVSHEWGHAYTEKTHGLIYQWQSGALNESYSDVWGETLDLINNREDEDEGDISAKRPVGVCSEHSPPLVRAIINSPSSIARICQAGAAQFGPELTVAGTTGDVVVGLDDTAAPGPSTTDACSALTNAVAMAGKLALVDRGGCGFAVKVKNAQNAGAIGVLVADNVEQFPPPMAGADPTITIPSLRIRLSDGAAIKGALSGGQTVNVTMKDVTGNNKVDSYRWLIGEKSGAFGGAIRDMWNPNCYGDPGKVSDAEYVCSTDDSGGVHSNSGVPNHGYSLLVDGGTFNGVTVSGIGLTKAAHIYFRAMSEYQTPVSDFTDHADALAASCADLTNKGLKELSTVPNDSQTSFNKITAADCAQVNAMALAVELRKPATQCNFGPQLDPNTPALCGAGTASKASFEDDFESGLGEWELDGDSVYGGPTRDWRSTGDLPAGNRPAGSTQAAFGPTPDLGTCTEDEADFSSVNTMTSPEIEVGETGDTAPKLVFDHNIQTELGYDGGTVKVAVNGGAFETVPESAYLFNGPTVLATEAAGNTNPLAGEDGFTGTDGGKIVSDWGTSIIDLEELDVEVGDTIEVQFAIGRDGCGGVVGWYVDNVRVITCYDLATSTITAAHVPNPSTYGQTHSVNVTVGGGTPAPTGTVTLKSGTATLGTATLNASGQASIPLDKLLPAGTYNLTATYSGDSEYDTSTTAFTGTVQKATGTIAAKAKPKKVDKGDNFKAKVTVTMPDGLKAVGTVTIVKKGKVLGEGTLDASGKVTIKLKANFKAGKTITLKAVLAGTANTNELVDEFELKINE